MLLSCSVPPSAVHQGTPIMVNGVLYTSTSLSQVAAIDAVTGTTKWVFDHPFFILLNVAVGGDFPGNPDATTTFPQTMLIDYIRLYEPAARLA